MLVLHVRLMRMACGEAADVDERRSTLSNFVQLRCDLYLGLYTGAADTTSIAPVAGRAPIHKMSTLSQA
jgi:hypothetical protein